jgi:hypothetical protein
MFQAGGLGVELFSSSGKDPAKNWSVTSNINRVYDRTVKGFVFLLERGANTQMCIPPDPSKEALGIHQSILVLQMRLQPSKHFSLDIVLLDDKNNKRRMHLSTMFRELECHSLHTQIPLEFNNNDKWINFIVDLDALIYQCFRGHKFQSVLYIAVKSVCRLRKVFSLPVSSAGLIPATFEFPPGTVFSNMVHLSLMITHHF